MVAAFVLIQVAAGVGWTDGSAIHMALHAVPGVKGVHFLTGPTDIIAFVEVADQKAMLERIQRVLTPTRAKLKGNGRVRSSPPVPSP